MSEDIFDDPGGGDTFSPTEWKGVLLLIKPLRVEVGVPTDYGKRDATVADVHALDGPRAGECLHGAYLWNQVLQTQVRGNLGTGRFNLGRFGQGQPKAGQSPPWKLLDPTEEDKALARKYIASDRYKENNRPVPQAEPTDPWSASNTPAAASAGAFGGGNDEPPF